MMLALLLLAAMAAAAPPHSPKLVVTKEFYPDSMVVYSGSHDIVEITVPLNLNDFNPFKDVDENTETNQHLSHVCFVEAELKDDAIKNHKGVYVLNNGTATKVLDKGQSVTFGDGNTIYIGASDGIYKYNPLDGTVEKYGSVSDSVIKMARDNFHHTIYYLTSDNVLYKFGDNETKSSKVETVKDARDIVFDYDGNMVYYDGSKQLFLYKDNQVVKIEGLPSSPAKVVLIKALLFLKDFYVVIDGSLYEITKEGKSKKTGVEFNAMPSAFAPEAYLTQYFAYNKKIYEYDLVNILQNNVIKPLNVFLTAKKEEIEAISKTKLSNL